ncbi:MAG: SAM-dependent methyltransferase, partial [Frankiaceae bacterium]
PVPDGTRDLTAHVAMDSVAVPGLPTALLRQADALPALTALTAADGAAPRSLQAMRDASLRARLLDPQGLGRHFWLVQAVGMGMPSALIR